MANEGRTRAHRTRVCSAVLGSVGLTSGLAIAQDIRCVALTGQQAPQAPAGALFAAIDHPTISSQGGIVVRATLAQGAGGVTADNDVGIWRFPLDNAAPQLVTREGAAAPMLPGVTVVELGLPVADPGSVSVGYWARLAGTGITPANDRAVFARDNISHLPWFQTGSNFFGTAEGRIGVLDDYRVHPVMYAGGLPAFTGALESGLAGVFAIDVTTDSIAVALQGAPAHDLPAGTLYGSDFSSPVRDSIGDVAYRASLQHGPGGVDASNDQVILIRMATDGAYYLVARKGQVIGHGADGAFDWFSDPIVSDEPRVGFKVGFRHGVGGIDDSNDTALCSLCPCGSIQLNAQAGDTVAGMVSGMEFDDFSLPLFSRDSRMMFGARLRGTGVSDSNDSSVWWTDIPFGFVMVAREGALAPGAGGATFTDFQIESPEFWLGTNEFNQLVFSGRLSSGRRGLWVFTPFRGVRALIIEGQSVQVAPGDTRQIVSIPPGAEGYWVQGRRAQTANTERLVAFRAEVSGGQTGIFLAELPDVSLGCPSDWDNSGTVNSQDFFAFLTDFFASAADINNSGATDSQDFFDFLAAFFAGC